MKLIDLLVQELPKQGGWPTASEGLALPLAGNDLVTSWRFNSELDLFVTCTYGSEVVTREEYEAAIAASQQPAWNGDGLPPVGCICEIAPPIHDAGTKVRVLCHDQNAAVCRILEGDQLHSLCQLEAAEIRPVRTEAERKREESISKIQSHAHVDFVAPISTGQAVALYDAIAAGKIPHITLK